MIIAFIGCLTGFIIMLVGAVEIALDKMNIPPSQAEIDQLKVEALHSKDPNEQALKWMYVSDAEAELQASRTTNPRSWIMMAFGLAIIIASILWAIQ
jgi:hypothetical protein